MLRVPDVAGLFGARVLAPAELAALAARGLRCVCGGSTWTIRAGGAVCLTCNAMNERSPT